MEKRNSNCILYTNDKWRHIEALMITQKKKFLGTLLSILISMLFCAPSIAAVQLPDKVRIGLLYDSTAAGVLNLSAPKGIQFGYYKDNNFTVLVEEPSGNNVVIRKDAYYIKNGSTFTEFKPDDKSIPAGENFGPFHIQIGSTYNDSSTALQQVQAAKQKGIAAYPVYTGSWQVWTGFYINQNTAQQDITSSVQSKLGGGSYNVTAPSANQIVLQASTGDTMMVFGSDTSHLQAHPKNENSPYSFKLNSKSYRGDLEIRRFSGSDMTAINSIPLEQYLYGVIPNEIESYSHTEALKAQAVAARTYTINNLGKRSKWDFDLCPNTSDQMYKGLDSETAATNKAVDDTKGKLVTYNGKPAQVFYFASSGGRTEDAKNVFDSDIPYLKSVDDKYELTNSGHYNWEVTLTAAKIKEIMLSRKYDLGDITGMSITKTSEAGRVTDLIIKGTNGRYREYIKDDCRNVFNLNSQLFTISTDSDTILKGTTTSSAVKVQLGDKKIMTANGLALVNTILSKNFSILGANNSKKAVSVIPTVYKLTGKGWGHAVGMSQEGAKGMANAGFKFDQILEHYFQGTKVE